MKFKALDNNYVIDGTSTMQITFEYGDIFIDSYNTCKMINEIHQDKVVLVDHLGTKTIENIPLNSIFLNTYRYAGCIINDNIFTYENALPLCSNC